MNYKFSKEEWINKQAGLSSRDKDLLSRAFDTLYSNQLHTENAPWGDYECISPWTGANKDEGIWNWDSAFHANTVSRFDSKLAQDCILAFTQFQMENGQFPDVIFADGTLADNYSKPPVMAWAVENVYKRTKNIDFIKNLYPVLLENEKWWRENRFYDGLFYYSANNNPQNNDYEHPRWESGLDNSPRWDNGIVDLWAIDLNCYMVMFYNSLDFLANRMNITNTDWKLKADKLSDLINKKMFCEKTGMYCDVNRFTGEFSSVLTPCSFMPLYTKIATQEYAEKMCKLASNPDKLYPFMPSVSYDNPQYSLDYWRGPVWLNIAYFAAKGLKNYGFKDVANDIKEAILNMVNNDKNGIFENYDSKLQKGIFCDNFSWSAAFIIEFILDF